MMKKTVLVFGFDEAEQKKAAAALMPLRLSVRAVDPKDYKKPLSKLTGYSSETRQESDSFSADENNAEIGKMLYIAGLDQEELNRLLAAMRRAGFPRSVLKAIATPDNIGWTPAELWSEISTEHKTIVSSEYYGR